MAHYLVMSTGDSGPGTLRSAIIFANAMPGTIITFAATLTHKTITLAHNLPLILRNGTVIDGSGAPHLTIDGGGHRVFFVGDTKEAISATIEDLTISHGSAKGGDGGTGGATGGGGAGLGGAIFVSDHASLAIGNLVLEDNSAFGGTGGSIAGHGASGGGGMGGDGGAGAVVNVPPVEAAPGGGGGFGEGADGGDGGGSPGKTGKFTNGGPGGGAFNGRAGGPNGGGGGGQDPNEFGYGAGGGGLSGGPGTSFQGGGGGFGGGAGGGGIDGGQGGFGGGGGGGNNSGPGGFGGGGGGAAFTAAPGGFDGGSGADTGNDGGGGGAGMGGAIFVMGGGSLTMRGAITVVANTITAGMGGGDGKPGRASGAGLFLQGDGTIRFSPGHGQSEHVFNAIDDQSGLEAKGYVPTAGPSPGSYTLVKSEPGTLFLSAHNAYSGGTALNGGTLELTALSAAGSGAITFAGKATLAIANAAFPSHVFANPIDAFGKPDTLDLSGLHFQNSAKATYDATNHRLTVDSGGIKDTFTLLSPKGTHFAAARDGHGGTRVTLEPPFAAGLASPALHDVGEQHWAADGAGGTHAMGGYLIVG